MSELKATPHSGQGASAYTVAIIDDDRITANGFAAFLEMLGFNSVIFAGPRQALTRLNQAAPDLILLDINMPGMDGYEVCRYFKRELTTAKTPIVIVSAHSSENDKALAFEAGASAYLVKPVTIEALKICVESFLRPAGADAIM